MKKNLILSLAFAFAVVGFSPVALANHNPGHNPGPPPNLHCPDHTTNPKVEDGDSPETVTVDGEDVTVTINGKKVKFTDNNGDEIEVEFCVKGGNELSNTGKMTGSKYRHLQDISYVVVYSVVDDEEPEEPEEPETPVTPETPTTPVAPSSTDVDEEEDQVEAPAAGVNAGSGNAATIATAAVALIGSLASLGYGIVRFTKFGA